MRSGFRFLLAAGVSLLGGCNMVISEVPIFEESDRAATAPRDGIWLSDDEDCRFDARLPEAQWPECALWLVVRDSGREVLLRDGKQQSQRLVALFAVGTPAVVQGQWIDDAKEPEMAHYGFYGLEPRAIGPEGVFSEASAWVVQCGVQDEAGGAIRPFPGISAECRPSSRDAVRSAALSSRQAGQVETWRWLRAEEPASR